MHSVAVCERAKSVREDCSAHRRPASRGGRIATAPVAERGLSVDPAAAEASTAPPPRPAVHRRADAASPHGGAGGPRWPDAHCCPVLLAGLSWLLLGPPPRPRRPPRGPDDRSACGRSTPEPEVVRGFEPPPTPTPPATAASTWPGAPGQAVLAALPGTVGFAGSIGGKPVVTVLHGGRRTTYEPVVASVERRPGAWRRATCSAASCSPTATASRPPACTGGWSWARVTTRRTSTR